MKTGRRGFFKLLGAGTAAAALPKVESPVVATIPQLQVVERPGNYAVAPAPSVGCNNVIVSPYTGTRFVWPNPPHDRSVWPEGNNNA